MLARAIVIPRGVSRRTALATTSRSLPEGRLSAGKIESKDAIPAVTFFSRHQHIAFSNTLETLMNAPTMWVTLTMIGFSGFSDSE